MALGWRYGHGWRTVSPPLLTTRQVAELLAVSPETVLRRVRVGELPAYRVASNALRFDPEAIAAWLERRAVPGPRA